MKNKKSNLEIYAEKELELLIEHQESLEKDKRLCINVKNYQKAFKLILEAFSKEGASGGSAPYQIETLINLLKDYLSWKPLTSFSFEDDKFFEFIKGMKQHKRVHSIFKDEKGIIYNIHGVVFHNIKNDMGFKSNAENVKYGDSVLVSKLRIEKDTITSQEIEPIYINVEPIGEEYRVTENNDKELIEYAIKYAYR